MNKETKVKILDSLLVLKEEGPIENALGICYNLREILPSEYGSEGKQFLLETIPNWPEYSGNLSYPVKHPDMEPEEAFNIVRDLWDDEYGDNRLALLDFLIETLQGELV